MSIGEIAGVAGLTPRVGSAAMAMITHRTEVDAHVIAFSDHMVEVYFNNDDSLKSVIDRTSKIPFGGTDCALPMLWALQNNISVDAFVIYTDSETYFGTIHPFQALQQYRMKTGINAKLIVVGMTSNGFTISNPEDQGMLDCCGFDTATPNLISDFIKS